MKKYLSVFEMITRSTLYKVLIVLVAMGAVQMSMFWAELMETVDNVSDKTGIGMEMIVDKSHLDVPLAVGFVLVTILLCWSGCNIGSNQGYTLRRLQIGERAVFGLQILYNCFSYILLWASQVAVTVGISCLYVQHASELTNQSIVLAYYKNSYMHSILPMEDSIGWLLIICLVLGCGVSSATFPVHQRRGKIAYNTLIAIAMAIVSFPNRMDTEYSITVACPFFAVIVLFAFAGVYGRMKEEQDDE